MQHDIAVIGMVCRVPGAENIDEFWTMLANGVEGLRPLTTSEKEKLPPHQENYITAGGFIDGIDLFDANHFSFTAKEAVLMDPQHRLWLQACWQALEITGQLGQGQSHVGVFASAGPSYYLNQILSNPDYHNQYQTTLIGNAPDCLATRVSYTLNLTGPSMTIQSGCSSSLVSLHQARLALLAKQCDVALAGGICLSLPQYQGYHYVEGGIASPDGHCRPFSDDAAGTVFSSGYGVVVLKRLADALTDGDNIYAVVKGSAVNNDGADKASFTAPSVSGQAAVIAKALRVANLSANDIQYIETHGTGTPIGDPIELAALEQAFKQSINPLHKTYALGSVKANVGHLDVAAGIVGFIKTCLMLHHKKITPQLHFQQWNKACLQAEKHFTVKKEITSWQSEGKRRAGVSAFGFGGTNAHIIVEEAPAAHPMSVKHPVLSHLIALSAKSSDGLTAWINTLCDYLDTHTDIALEDLAYTLQTGRPQLNYRIMIAAHSIKECVQILRRTTEADFVHCTMNATPIEVTGKTAHEIQQAWSRGHILNWKKAYTGLGLKKTLLPNVPLQLQSYWVEPASQHKGQSPVVKPDKQLYRSTWEEKLISPTASLELAQPILIFSCGNQHLGKALTAYLEQKKVDYVVVYAGECYEKLSEFSYTIRPQHREDYEQLENTLAKENKLPKLCFFNMAIEKLEQHTDYPLNVLFALVKQSKLMRSIKQLTTVVSGMESFQCSDNYPALACLIAFSRGIGQEFPNIKTQLLDLGPDDVDSLVQQIIGSVCSPQLNDVLVWRDKKCWQQTYQLQPSYPESNTYFQRDGIYLITGGLGDVASVHVDFLASEYHAKLILIGRTPFPAQEKWASLLADTTTDSRLKTKILRLKAWQEAGYRIHIYTADVTDLVQMRGLFQQIEKEVGRLNGIIHIAGAGSDMHYKVLSEINWEHCWKLLSPKLQGIQVLGQLSTEFSVSRCLIISSISSALTGIGLSAYGATHNVLDAMVNKLYPHWRTMNWDAWSFYQNEQKQHGELGVEMDKLAIKPQDGLRILREAFQMGNWQQLFVSSASLSERYQYWAQRGFLEKSKTASIAKHPRPHLHNEYSAPIVPLQSKLATLWQSLLGIEKVGIHDNFFELGGHSLLALELISQLQNEFDYACSVVDLFESPTISQLANKMQPSTVTQSVVSAASERVKKQLAARKAMQSKEKVM